MKYLRRPMREEDKAILVALNQSRDKRMGTNYWLPPLKECDQVWVFEKDGVVVGAFLLKKVHETILTGDSPDLVAACLEHQEEMRVEAQAAGIEELVGFVPRGLADRKGRGMEKLMKRGGYRRLDGFVVFESRTKEES